MEDETGKRVYEGVVELYGDDRTEGYWLRDGEQVSSDCNWLNDFDGKRVRITVEVIE